MKRTILLLAIIIQVSFVTSDCLRHDVEQTLTVNEEMIYGVKFFNNNKGL